MFIDTHVHYNLDPLSDHWQIHWQKAQEFGVSKSIVVGTSVESTDLAAVCAKQTTGLFFSAGIHPITVNNSTSLPVIATQITALQPYLEHKKIVAIGECGLDYYRIAEDVEERQAIILHQKHLFVSQIELAIRLRLPLILHVRDRETPELPTRGNAYWDTLEILQDFEVPQFVLHCVSGPKLYVQQAVEMGGYMGFDGNLTYPNAHHIREIFQSLPPDRRLLETDAPYLPPREFRGKMSEPWMISLTGEFVEKELHSKVSTLSENAEQIFDFGKS